MFAELKDFAPIEGALNTHTFVLGTDGKKYLKRYPKENLFVMSFIKYEQEYLGFTQLGGRFRRRSSMEQKKFAEKARDTGLRVLSPIYIDEKNVSYYEFLPDVTTLDKFLPNAATQDKDHILLQMVNDLRTAHNRGFIYGDRWSENMLIIPQYGLMHIDFDLEIFGNNAKELELAQIAFYSVCGGKETVLPILSELLSAQKQYYNFTLVEQFALRLSTHFQNHKIYGNAFNNCAQLFDLINKNDR